MQAAGRQVHDEKLKLSAYSGSVIGAGVSGSKEGSKLVFYAQSTSAVISGQVSGSVEESV